MTRSRTTQHARAKAIRRVKTQRIGGHVVLIGLGNIGSPLCDLLARSPSVARLTLVDKDVYEEANLPTQSIRAEDVGEPKAVVQARRMRQIRPSLEVESIHAAVEDVPTGRLRGDVVLTGLDSKVSRQHVNQRIWRLGIPWVDAGVLAADTLARVNVYRPGPGQPCLECAWTERDYETLEVKRPCQAEGPARTGAPAFLGSLAAALQMAECEKILAGTWNSVAVGRQITIAVGARKLFETVFRQNPNCRFDHDTCAVRPLHCSLLAASLGGLFTRLKSAAGCGQPLRLHVEGRRFERQLQCACGESRPVFCLEGRMTKAERVCPRCGAMMVAAGFTMLPGLDEAMLAPGEKKLPLAALGLATGDWIRIKAGQGFKTFELTTP